MFFRSQSTACPVSQLLECKLCLSCSDPPYVKLAENSYRIGICSAHTVVPHQSTDAESVDTECSCTLGFQAPPCSQLDVSCPVSVVHGAVRWEVRASPLMFEAAERQEKQTKNKHSCAEACVFVKRHGQSQQMRRNSGQLWPCQRSERLLKRGAKCRADVGQSAIKADESTRACTAQSGCGGE